MSVICLIIGAILKLILLVESWILQLVGWCLSLLLAIPSNVAAFSGVQVGWVVARDIVNMFFVLVLLVIAFATILRIETYNYKKLLPRLIVGILLVNFSRTICAFFIEISNLLMKAFTFGQSVNAAEGLANNLGLQGLSSVSGSKTWTDITDFSMVGGMLVFVLFIGVFIAALGAVTVLLLVRLVALMFLTVVSPVAFFFGILPQTQEYSKKWWGEFTKYIIYGPAATFCIFLSLKIFSTIKTTGIKALVGEKGDVNLQGLVTAGNKTIGPSEFSNDQFMIYLLAMTMMFATVLIVKGVGSFGADKLLGMAKGLPGKGWGLTKGIGGRMDKSFRKGKYGLGAIASGWGAGLVGGIGGLISGKGFRAGAASFGGRIQDAVGRGLLRVSPTTLKEAYHERQAKLLEEAQAGVKGRTQAWMNRQMGRKPFSYKDQIDYEELDRNRAVEKSKKEIMERNPNIESEALMSDLSKALIEGNKVGARATMELLFVGNNHNEIFKRAAADEDFRKQVFGSDFLNSEYAQKALQDEDGNFRLPDNVETKKAILENICGKKQAVTVARDLAMTMMGKGNYDMQGITEYDRDTGDWGWVGDQEIAKMNQEGETDVVDQALVRDSLRGKAAATYINKQQARGVAGAHALGRQEREYDAKGNEVYLGQSIMDKHRGLGITDPTANGTFAEFNNIEAGNRMRIPGVNEAMQYDVAVSIAGNLGIREGEGTADGASTVLSYIAKARDLKTTKDQDGLVEAVKKQVTNIFEGEHTTPAALKFREAVRKIDPRKVTDKNWENFYQRAKWDHEQRVRTVLEAAKKNIAVARRKEP